MIHDYIAKLYQRGQDEQARRAIAAEITRQNTPEDEPPTYEPTEAEIDAVEAGYYASRRSYRYGSPVQQVEYITEQGLTAWKTRVTAIKAEIPKPEA